MSSFRGGSEFEAKLHMCKKSRGGALVTIELDPTEETIAPLMIMPLGTRLKVKWEIIPDEESLSDPRLGTPDQVRGKHPHPHLALSHILSQDPLFWQYMEVDSEFGAATKLRHFCGISSRAELKTSADAQERMDQIGITFRDWKSLHRL